MALANDVAFAGLKESSFVRDTKTGKISTVPLHASSVLAKKKKAEACMTSRKVKAMNPGNTNFGGPRLSMSKKDIKGRHFSTKTRKKMAKQGTAEPDGSYPITKPKDVSNAVEDWHRSGGSSKDKAHIRNRAKSLGLGDPFKKKK